MIIAIIHFILYLLYDTITKSMNQKYKMVQRMAIPLFREPAHKDWLEIAINQGVFRIIIYTIYW